MSLSESYIKIHHLLKSVGEYHSVDGGKRWDKREYPASISSDRVHIRYGDEGGLDKDGVIEIRPGVADLNLGKSHYAQVRIMVDDSHYLKGMAMYSDNIPDGADVVFNTNKKSGTPKMDVLKRRKMILKIHLELISRLMVKVFMMILRENIQTLKPVRNSLCLPLTS